MYRRLKFLFPLVVSLCVVISSSPAPASEEKADQPATQAEGTEPPKEEVRYEEVIDNVSASSLRTSPDLSIPMGAGCDGFLDLSGQEIKDLAGRPQPHSRAVFGIRLAL